MAFGYPISLEVAGRRAVVIGRTAVAQGKADALLEAGAAQVIVISPGPGPALARLERQDRATVLRRDYQPGDLEGAFLCVASSENANVRAAVHAEARWRRVLVNVMDDIPHCDFAAPALVRRGNLAIAISTGGRSPALARRLRQTLSRQFDPRWEELVDLLGEVRMETLPDLRNYGERARRWQEAIDVDLLLDLIGQGRRGEARTFLIGRLLGVEGSSSNERGESRGGPPPRARRADQAAPLPRRGARSFGSGSTPGEWSSLIRSLRSRGCSPPGPPTLVAATPLHPQETADEEGSGLAAPALSDQVQQEVDVDSLLPSPRPLPVVAKVGKGLHPDLAQQVHQLFPPGVELSRERLAKAPGERRRPSACRDGDGEVPPPYKGGRGEVAVRDVVHDVHQDSSPPRLGVNGRANFRILRGSHAQESPLEVPSLIVAAQDGGPLVALQS